MGASADSVRSARRSGSARYSACNGTRGGGPAPTPASTRRSRRRPLRWGGRLSQTKVIFSQCAYHPSSQAATSSAQSTFDRGVRISRTSCTGCSSMLSTRHCSSCGRAWASSIPSMPAANSASASGGKTRYWSLRPQMPVFWRLRDGLVADRLDDAEFHDPPGEQAQRPRGVAPRRRPELQGDNPCLLPAVKQLGDRWGVTLLAVEGPLEASGTQRRRTYSTVAVRQRQVLAISASIQASGPSASASSWMWVQRAFWLAVLSRSRVSSHSERSSSVSRTIYFFPGMEVPHSRLIC